LRTSTAANPPTKTTLMRHSKSTRIFQHSPRSPRSSCLGQMSPPCSRTRTCRCPTATHPANAAN
jgi:hypothetical protein